jgi:ribulose-phosphate 3-epimerase
MPARGTLIAPSLLSADFARLKDEIQAVEAAGADWLHIDVMDGHFVPNLTMGMFIVEAINRLSDLPLDCHLMIQHPERYAVQFAKAGADYVSIHPEADMERPLRQILEDIAEAGAAPALALKPATPVSALKPGIGLIKLALVMTVNPGFSGQELITDCLPKYAQARGLLGPEVLLEIDGGVKAHNAKAVREAGAEVLVAASAIFGSDDYAKAIRQLRDG